MRNESDHCAGFTVNLSSIKKGGVARVECIDLSGPLLEKCIRLGIIPGSSVQVLHRYYSNLIVKLDNMKLAINDEVAKHILVLSDER